MFKMLLGTIFLASLLGCSLQAATSNSQFDAINDCIKQVETSDKLVVLENVGFSSPQFIRTARLEQLCRRELELQALNPAVRRVIERWEFMVVCRAGADPHMPSTSWRRLCGYTFD